MDPAVQQLAEEIRAAAASRGKLRIRGSGSKDFYGERIEGDILATGVLTGIVAYEPTELVTTVRAGTPLAVVESTLAQQGQCLPFEPPWFGPGATIGGAVASGLSGPRRMQVGALRDFVLGVRIIDGNGDLLTFGGQVMKNVAGFDVSRLIAGSLGTLGLITEVSLKVLPKPAAEATLRLDIGQPEALALLNQWGGQPLPVAATAWHDDCLTVRLAGANAAGEAGPGRLRGGAGGERRTNPPLWT